jgi:hypothetical protein
MREAWGKGASGEERKEEMGKAPLPPPHLLLPPLTRASLEHTQHTARFILGSTWYKVRYCEG